MTRFYLDNAGFAPPKIGQKSCTELLVRVMVEARSADVAQRCAVLKVLFTVSAATV
jgi:hypothetical protein